MATPKTKIENVATVDDIAAKQMGLEPQMQTTPPEEAKKEDSAEGMANEKGSPETEGDKMTEDAIIYEVKFNEDEKRKLTPQQIASTFQRYAALNHKNAQYKPVMDLVEQIMRENPGMDSKHLADMMQNIYKAQTSNPTMGNTEGAESSNNSKKAGQNAGDLDSILNKWEEENAASLPPGYKDMLVGQNQSMSQMQQQLVATQNMLRQVMAQTQGVADAARTGMHEGQTQQIDAVRRQIANNIDRTQQVLNLPDDKANDFMIFAAERGYTMEDFVDTQLTIKVMQDFKNEMDSPEMERMREIAQRRQAFTGSLGTTPSTSSAAVSAPSDSTFDKFTSAAMSKRGIG